MVPLEMVQVWNPHPHTQNGFPPIQKRGKKEEIQNGYLSIEKRAKSEVSKLIMDVPLVDFMSNIMFATYGINLFGLSPPLYL